MSYISQQILTLEFSTFQEVLKKQAISTNFSKHVLTFSNILLTLSHVHIKQLRPLHRQKVKAAFSGNSFC